MTIKEACNAITTDNNLFQVKWLVKNHLKANESNCSYYCNNHKKYHKYVFHSRISFCPGTSKMYGVDTKEELIKLAKTFIKP